MALPGVAALPPDHGTGEAGNRGPWYRQGFRLYWSWRSRAGRQPVNRETRKLIRQMCVANPLWAAPRIHGELLKLGIKVSPATVAKYMLGRPHSPSSYLAQLPAQKPRTGRCRHRHVYRSFGNVPATIRDVILAHDRHKIVRFDVTQHPTVGWLSRQVNRGVPMG